MRADLAFGQRVEKLAANKIIPQVFRTCETQSVGSNRHWRRHGVDFVLHDKFVDEKLLIEIKADRHKTGNIVIEKFTVKHEDMTEKLGWLHTSKADYLIYCLLHFRKAVLLDLPKMRHLLDENPDKFKVKKTNSGWGHTFFYVIPVKFLEENFEVLEFEENEWNTWLSEYGVDF